MRKVKVGIVGLGNISGSYLKNLTGYFKNVEITAVCDLDTERVKEKMEEFSLGTAMTYDEILNSDVEIILNLTTPKTHYKICKDALMAGKHVHVEKPLSLTYKEGKELVELAKEKGLMLGGAPDTFLGAGVQTAIWAIKQGLIGDVTSAFAFMLCHGHESWHPDPEFYYEVGGGPMFDMGPYYLTALVSMLGGADTICGMTNKAYDKRMITSEKKNGKVMDVEVQTHVDGLIHFENGAIANIVTSFDIYASQIPKLEVHGTRGSLVVPDPNTFGGEVLIRQGFEDRKADFQKLPLVTEYSHNARGIAIADMAQCILDGTLDNRASGELALHVLEIMEKLHTSWETKSFIELESRPRMPKPIPLSLTTGYLK